jgi:hypothetical protein
MDGRLIDWVRVKCGPWVAIFRKIPKLKFGKFRLKSVTGENGRSIEGYTDFDTSSGVKFRKSILILKNTVTAKFGREKSKTVFEKPKNSKAVFIPYRQGTSQSRFFI